MCTLIVFNEFIDGYPLVVAGNRDERYNRISESPELMHTVDTDFIMPWDKEKDGTWLGVAQDGWVVALTNQDDGKHDATALSRGKVVSDCLHTNNHAASARVLLSLDKTRYNPFNIVFGRPGAMFLCRVCPGCELELEPLPVGVNVISNDCCGDRYKRKVEQAFNACNEIDKSCDIESLRKKMLTILSNHSNSSFEDPFQSLCVHAETHEFGTRSSSVITVSNSNDVEYWYSEGHPCHSSGLMLAGTMTHRLNEEQ